MRAIGVDPGTKRVGVAVCDDEGTIALPRPALGLAAPTEARARIRAFALEEKAEVIVLGLPIDMSGREGLAAKKSRGLAAALVKDGLRVVLWDERASTVAAGRDLARAGFSAKEARGKIDSAAATLLLQSWLDAPEHARGGR